MLARSFCDLPTAILADVLRRLRPLDKAAVAATCHTLLFLVTDTTGKSRFAAGSVVAVTRALPKHTAACRVKVRGRLLGRAGRRRGFLHPTHMRVAHKSNCDAWPA